MNVSYRDEERLRVSYTLTNENRLFSPEEKIKMMEKQVNTLIEESCLAASRGEFQLVSPQTTNLVNVLLLKKYVFFLVIGQSKGRRKEGEIFSETARTNLQQRPNQLRSNIFGIFHGLLRN